LNKLLLILLLTIICDLAIADNSAVSDSVTESVNPTAESSLEINKKFESLESDLNRLKDSQKIVIDNVEKIVGLQKEFHSDALNLLEQLMLKNNTEDPISIKLIQPTNWYIFILPLVTMFIVICGTVLSIKTISLKSKESLLALENSNDNQYQINRENLNSTNELLVHEKDKFRSEQKLNLKKEVFLDLASSFADVLGVIPKLMKLEYSEKDINDQMKFHGGIVAKSYLVAEEKSVAEILKYSAETGEVFINLIRMRAVLLDHKEAIRIYQGTIDSANAEKNRIVSMMKEFNLQGRNDAHLFDHLNKSYDFHDEAVKENTESKSRQESKLKPLHLDFAKKCIDEHSRLLSLLPPMTIALRKELDNDEDSDIFVKALNSNVSRMRTAFGDVFKKAEA